MDSGVSAMTAVSVGAGIESFYRSAANSIASRAIVGTEFPLFPRMHVQLPTRIMYINGIKGVREAVDGTAAHPALKAIAPGLVMTPISSVLEATIVSTEQSLLATARRGLMARGVREVIFGVGINQSSDWCSDSLKGHIEQESVRTMTGSLLSGVVAGYLSHIPHNLSTIKMVTPDVSYAEMLRSQPSLLLPRGLIPRTAQISGSFMIINSVVHYLKDDPDAPQ